jgi:hypothetical protein
MTWLTPTNAEIAAPIGARIDVVAFGVNVIDATGGRDAAPKNQGVTYRNLWPHHVIRRGDAVRPLPPHATSLPDLTFEVGDARLRLRDYMIRRRTYGLLILKRGEVALERYGIGSGPESRGKSWSTAKSITSTLVGAALHDGAIGSVPRHL